MSRFAWLDHSEAQRRRMLEIIDLFRDRSTVDDLGIGTVRDAIADGLFPGTSTLHTRVRYFLFIPWVYLELEHNKVPSAQAASVARRREIWISSALLNGGETTGVVGRGAGPKLKRLPSILYWGGLSRWGVRVFPGSQDSYHRSLDSFYRARDAAAHGGDGPIDRIPVNWHPGIPEPPSELYEETTFALTTEEADFLRDRVTIDARGTLLAHLANSKLTADVAFPWQHPLLGDFPEPFVDQLAHARNFSEALFPASVLYNLMLAEATDREDLVERYRALYDEAREQVVGALDRFRSWDRTAFWVTVTGVNPRVPAATRTFVETWLDLTLRDEPDLEPIRGLLSTRERAMKGRRARLTNRDALERWGGESSAFQQSFRWPNVQPMVNDIIRGMDRVDARA